MLTEYAIVACAALVGLIVATAASLKAWQGWLALKLRELERHPAEIESGPSLIELADLRERIRKLEAIAAGVEL